MKMNPPEGTSRALRNIAIVFVGVTVLLLGVIAYMAFSTAVIVVRLSDVSKPIQFRIPLVEQKLGVEPVGNAVTASFIETTETAEGTFVPEGDAQPTGKPGGSVTIRNNTANAQPLVATTRLLSADGVLFRLPVAVRVPANGSINALVEADQDSDAALIGPSRFTIPGLNTTLQQSIFAESSEPMVRGAAAEKTVTADDLEKARASLQKQVVDKARALVTTQVPTSALSDEDFLTTIVSENSSAKAGDRVQSFTMSLTTNSVAVLFDKSSLAKAIAAQSGGANVSADNLTYTIAHYDAVAKTATVTGSTSVASALNRNSSIFNIVNFVGMQPAEVKSFLENYQGVDAVNVLLSPYWQKQLPRIPARIHVQFE